MTGRPSALALSRYAQATAALLEDPEVTGELLLIALWIARAYHLGDPPPDGGEWTWGRVAIDVFGGSRAQGTVPAHHLHRVRAAVRADRPRYDPAADNATAGMCSAPMIRRPGTCGQSATTWGYQTDPATGRRVALGTCSRHTAWYRRQLDENAAAVEAAGDRLPVPAPNVGGALARHFPTMNWPAIWRKLEPGWTPPPAGGVPTRPPKLTVLVNTEPEDAFDQGRPELTALEGGWRDR